MSELNSGGQEDYGVFTLNEITVGAYGNNRKRSDVQLIQFFLQQFFFNHIELFDVVPRTKNGAPVIKIDGVCGPQTIAAIRTFQKNREVPADGLVSVVNRFINLQHQHYTILLLNNYFRLHGNGKEFHGQLEKHPNVIDFAPELQAELSAKGVENTMIKNV